jgi:hypothetical protein
MTGLLHKNIKCSYSYITYARKTNQKPKAAKGQITGKR